MNTANARARWSRPRARRSAAAVGAQPAEVVWTSGATEANNLAIFGVAHYYRERRAAHRHGAHRAQVGARSVPRARAARLARHLPHARTATALLDPGASGGGAARPRRCWCPSCTSTTRPASSRIIAAIAALCAQLGQARLHVDAAQSVGKCALDFARARRRSHVAVRAQGLRPEGRRRAGGLARGGACSCTPLLHTAADRSGRCARAPGDASGGRHGRGVRAGERGARTRARARGALAGAAVAGAQRARRRVPATATRRARCRTCSTCRSRASRARVCSPRCGPYVAVSTGSACTSALPRAFLRAARLGPRRSACARAACASAWAASRSEADIDAAGAAVTRAVRRLRRIGGRVNYNELTRRYFEHAGCVRCFERTRHVPRRRGQPRARHLGAIRRAGGGARRGSSRPCAFLAFGCPHVIAVAAWLAEQAAGPARGAGAAGERAARCVSASSAGGEAGPPAHRRGRLDCRMRAACRCRALSGPANPMLALEFAAHGFCAAAAHEHMLKNAL